VIQTLQCEHDQLVSQVDTIRDTAVEIIAHSGRYSKTVEPQLTLLNQRCQQVTTRLKVDSSLALSHSLSLSVHVYRLVGLFTSAEDVFVFLPFCVCLHACQSVRRITRNLSTMSTNLDELWGGVGCVTNNNGLGFDADPDRDADPEIFSGILLLRDGAIVRIIFGILPLVMTAICTV